MAYPYEAANSYDAATGKQNVETKNTIAYLTQAGATQLKVGAGYVDLISGYQGTGAVQLYDVSSATTASLATLSQFGGVPAASLAVVGGVNVPTTTFFHGQLNNGIYVNIVSTATVANLSLSFS